MRFIWPLVVIQKVAVMSFCCHMQCKLTVAFGCCFHQMSRWGFSPFEGFPSLVCKQRLLRLEWSSPQRHLKMWWSIWGWQLTWTPSTPVSLEHVVLALQHRLISWYSDPILSAIPCDQLWWSWRPWSLHVRFWASLIAAADLLVPLV